MNSYRRRYRYRPSKEHRGHYLYSTPERWEIFYAVTCARSTDAARRFLSFLMPPDGRFVKVFENCFFYTIKIPPADECRATRDIYSYFYYGSADERGTFDRALKRKIAVELDPRSGDLAQWGGRYARARRRRGRRRGIKQTSRPFNFP